MDKSRATIDASIREYASDERLSQETHPEIETLTAYHEGQLDAEGTEKIRDHLTLCDECAQLVLDLGQFARLEPPSEEYRLSPQDKANMRQALESRLHGEVDTTAKVLEFTPRPEPDTVAEKRQAAIPVWYHGLVAALFAATVGLGFWVATQQPAGGNVDLISLFPVTATFRGSSPDESLTLKPHKELVLSLELLDEHSYAGYRLTILDSSGQTLWQGDDLDPTEAGNFLYVFPEQIRSPGIYRLSLHGLQDGSETLIAEYRLTLE